MASLMFNRIKFSNTEAAIRACLSLLDIVACPLSLDSINFRLPYIRDSFSWALQSLQRIWSVVFEWCESTGPSQEENQSLNLVNAVVALFRKWFGYSLRLGLGFDEKASLVWLRCGCDMLASEKFRICLDMQQLLSQLLNEAITASHSSPAIGYIIEENFLQPLTDIQRDSQTYGSLHQSLQVRPFKPEHLCLCFLLLICALQHILPRILNREYTLVSPQSRNDKRSSLGRRELVRNKSSTSRFSRHEDSTSDGESEGRARKRLRLSDVNELAAGADLSNMIMSSVYSSIGRYPDNEFDPLEPMFL